MKTNKHIFKQAFLVVTFSMKKNILAYFPVKLEKINMKIFRKQDDLSNDIFISNQFLTNFDKTYF